MNDSLFNEVNNQDSIDENKDYFTELVGEDKKFKDAKALAKAKMYSDRHIATLEQEIAAKDAEYLQLREQAVAGAKLQALLDRLEAQQEQQLTSREQTLNSNEDTKPSSVDLNQIESLFDNKLKQHEQRRIEETNWSKVKTKLEEKYGDKFYPALQDQAANLGLTKKEVDDMARRNPSLFFKTFDLTDTKPENFRAPPKSTVTFTPKGEKRRNYAYYQELNKKTPGIWLNDPKLRIQMEKDAQEQGEAFYS